MGRNDFNNREAKKPKKDAKKNLTASLPLSNPALEVEIIRKGKKHKGNQA
jgi:hypothetical protein